MDVGLGMAGDSAGVAEPVKADEVSEVPPEQVSVSEPEAPELADRGEDLKAVPPDPVQMAELVRVEVAPARSQAPLEPVKAQAQPLEPRQAVNPEPAPRIAAITPETHTEIPELRAVEPLMAAQSAVVSDERDYMPVPHPVEKPAPPKRPASKKPPRGKTSNQPAKQQKAKPTKKVAALKQVARADADRTSKNDVETPQTGAAGAGGTAGGAKNTGHSSDAAAGGNPGATRDYIAQLAAILTRYKRYPRRAKSRRQQGVGRLYFAVDTQGRVIASSLRQSSGYPLLDDEILAIVARVGRFPPIPDDLGQTRVDVVVPIRFSLR